MKALLISACLLGTPCRYDGRSKGCKDALALKNVFRLIPVCPEMLGGLETPRLPCEIRGGRVIRKDGKDLSCPYEKGARRALELAKQNGCTAALLKEKSPSCGSRLRYDGTFSGQLVKGQGVTAALLEQNGIRVYSEDQIPLMQKEKESGL